MPDGIVSMTESQVDNDFCEGSTCNCDDGDECMCDAEE